MDFFNIFEYELSPNENQGKLSFFPLKRVKVTKVNINVIDTFSFDDSENVTEFENLDFDITQGKVHFTKMIQTIVKSINEMMINFVNVTLLCDDTRLFTQIIPKQCERRELAVPYVFMNFLDIREIIRSSYQCPCKKLDEIVDFLNICPLKETQNKTQTELLEKILKKLHKDNLLLSTSQRFIEKCKKVIQQTEKAQQLNSKYYKIIGLPFKSFPGQIMQILAPQVSHDQKEICFIYERQRFSGRAILKIPEDYEPYLLPKNRMYIGPRYIELEASTEKEFEKAKIKLENRSIESQSSKHRDPRENQRDLHSIGPGSRRERSRSPIEHRRSRDRHESFRNERHEDPRQFGQDYQGAPGEYGIKIRGLPFSFTEWDIENIFSPYNMVGGSVKMGIKPGTTLKNGEAVILMRNYNDAQRSLGMNGFRCLGRYLEVKVIGKDDYLRYK